MVSRFRYEPLVDDAFEGALMVVAFPSPGFVAQVVARHIIASQSLSHVGDFRCDGLSPAMVVEGGIPQHPIRVYVGAHTCGLDHECDALGVILSDLALPEDLQADFARALLDWGHAAGVEAFLALEGMPYAAEGERESRVSGASVLAECRDRLQKVGIPMLDGVLVAGPTAALFAAAKPEDPCVLGLFAEAHNQFQDAAAAAKLVESIDKLLLHVPIDATPLRKRAEELTARLQQSSDRSRTAMSASIPMYG